MSATQHIHLLKPKEDRMPLNSLLRQIAFIASLYLLDVFRFPFPSRISGQETATMTDKVIDIGKSKPGLRTFPNPQWQYTRALSWKVSDGNNPHRSCHKPPGPPSPRFALGKDRKSIRITPTLTILISFGIFFSFLR